MSFIAFQICMRCYRQKLTIWPENQFLQKNTLKAFSRRNKIGITSLWEDLEDKLLTPGQLLGCPWKRWGITVQTKYWEGRWHQNWVCSRSTKNSTKAKQKLVKNGIFFTLRPPARKLRKILWWGQRVRDLRFVGSCKIFPNCVKFWGNNADLLGNYQVIYALNE